MSLGNAGGGCLGRTRPWPAARKLKVQLREEAVEFAVIYKAELVCALEKAEELPPGSEQSLRLRQLTRAAAARRSRKAAARWSCRGVCRGYVNIAARRRRIDTCVGSQLS